jgi:hypothetical protein
MEKNNKPTVGKIASELAYKDPGDHTFAEQGKEQLKDYLPNLISKVEEGKKSMPNSNFYIVVLTKCERLLRNVYRHYFFTRISCPTPDYDQAVYLYRSDKDELEFLWVVPDPRTIRYFMDNVFDIPEEDRCLLKYIFDFNDGKLDKLARSLNGEKEEQLNPIINIT